jgi:hypothetical protein
VVAVRKFLCIKPNYLERASAICNIIVNPVSDFYVSLATLVKGLQNWPPGKSSRPLAAVMSALSGELIALPGGNLIAFSGGELKTSSSGELTASSDNPMAYSGKLMASSNVCGGSIVS